jgi:excinuclease UvrABC ATPase subunit
LDDLNYLCEETPKMDPDQRKVVDIGVQYAQNIRKSALSKSSYKPLPPLVVVHGGAGCGKSFVISTVLVKAKV